MNFSQTKSAGVTVGPISNIVVIGSLSCGGSTGGQTCTTNIAGAVGADQWTVMTYASVNGTGPALSIAILAKTIVAGAVNTSALTLNPVLSSMDFVPTSSTCTAGSPCTESVVANFLDVAGAIIVGPGNFVNSSGTATPITLTGATALTLENPVGAGAATTINQASDETLSKFVYDGSGVSGTKTITAAASGVATATYLFSVAQQLFVVDTGNARLISMTSAGVYISQLPCSSGACTPSTADGQFDSPQDAANDSNGNVWVTDYSANRVDKFGPTGTYILAIGAGYQGVTGTKAVAGSKNGQFSRPQVVVVDSANNIWVTDSGNNRVQEFTNAGAWIKSIGGPNPYTCETSPAAGVPACVAGAGNGQFNSPYALAFDNGGNLWVADYGNSRIEQFTSGGVYSQKFSLTGVGGAIGIAIDVPQNIWVPDCGDNNVQEFTKASNYASKNTFGTAGTTNGKFECPQTSTIDASGNIWIDDSTNNRLQVFNSSFVFQYQVGCASGVCTTGSGTTQINDPQGINFGQ